MSREPVYPDDYLPRVRLENKPCRAFDQLTPISDPSNRMDEAERYMRWLLSTGGRLNLRRLSVPAPAKVAAGVYTGPEDDGETAPA